MSSTPSAETDIPATAAICAENHSPASASEPSPAQGMTLFPQSRSNQWVVAGLCLILTGWVCYRWVELSYWGSREIEIQRQPELEYAYIVNLNTATWIELALLEGIGEVLGKKIVADREANGPFRNVEDLTRVRGIGDKKLEPLRKRLYVDLKE